MKKHYCIQSFRAKSVLMRCMKKIPLAMRCTLFMLFCLVGMTFANEGYAQKTMVNIALEDKTVDEVLTELEQGTEFVFFYNNKQIDVKRRVSVRANNKTIFKVLNDVFKGTNIGYKVLDRNIILYDKAIGADGIQATLQAATVKGSVVDATGEPVIGASVVVEGTTNGTITDFDGRFALQVPSGKKVVISFVGYVPQTIAPKQGKDFRVVLKEDSKMLDEVVVVGYGTQKAKDVTGSIGVITPSEISDLPVSNLGAALAGQIPGLSISGGDSRPGEGATMSIRQSFSYSKDGGSTNPMVIIDDVIQIDANSGLPTLETFNALDPSEIESISVLRDASAAIYGSRASQGAIIVKTKRGKSGAPKINYSGKFGFNDAVGHPKTLKGAAYGRFANSFNLANNKISMDPDGNWMNKIYNEAELAEMDGLNYNWLDEA